METGIDRQVGTLWLRVSGRVTGDDALRFAEFTETAIDEDDRAAILDCEHLSCIGSMCLRTVIMTAKRLMLRGTAFMLCAPSSTLCEELQISGIGRIVTIHPTGAGVLEADWRRGGGATAGASFCSNRPCGDLCTGTARDCRGVASPRAGTGGGHAASRRFFIGPHHDTLVIADRSGSTDDLHAWRPVAVAGVFLLRTRQRENEPAGTGRRPGRPGEGRAALRRSGRWHAVALRRIAPTFAANHAEYGPCTSGNTRIGHASSRIEPASRTLSPRRATRKAGCSAAWKPWASRCAARPPCAP
jgi:anti-anti-sigma factor